ncbi:hypothetical protein BH10BAC5_BH10BAC5_15060 [soil metagenome]
MYLFKNISLVAGYIVAFSFFIVAGTFSQENPAKTGESLEIRKDDDLNARQIIEKYKPALVSIWYVNTEQTDYYGGTDTAAMKLSGSGFIFNEEGLIGTNYHVIDPIDSIIVKTSDGIFYPAEIILIDEAKDYAILKIINESNKKFPVVKLSISDQLFQGQEVFAIGSPLGFEYTISQGIIAAVRENEKVSFTDPVTYMPVEKVFEKVIQITAAISPGNSGGALFNSKGDVIGITTYTYGGYGNLNFAVSIEGFKKLTEVISDKSLAEDYSIKSIESIYNKNIKNAENLYNILSYDWHYSKERDTMKKADEFTIKRDSVNKIYLSKAENFYYKAIDIMPDTFRTYKGLLELYVLTESFAKAEDLYLSIKEKFSADSLLNSLSYSLASAYSNSKDFKKAIQFYDKFYAIDTTNLSIRIQVADLYKRSGDKKTALKIYNEIIKKDSSMTNAYIDAGVIYYENYNNTEKAKEYFDSALERELKNNGYAPYNIMLYYYLAKIAINENRKLDAILSYMDMKQIYSSTPDENMKKAEIYKLIKNMDE